MVIIINIKSFSLPMCKKVVFIRLTLENTLFSVNVYITFCSNVIHQYICIYYYLREENLFLSL